MLLETDRKFILKNHSFPFYIYTHNQSFKNILHRNEFIEISYINDFDRIRQYQRQFQNGCQHNKLQKCRLPRSRVATFATEK